MSAAQVVMIVVFGLALPIGALGAIAHHVRSRREARAAAKRIREQRARSATSKLGGHWLAHQQGRGLS